MDGWGRRRLGALHAAAPGYSADRKDGGGGGGVIVTSTGGVREYEAPRKKQGGEIVWPTLHLSLYQGSIGLAGACFLPFRCGVRATARFDLFHRLQNVRLDSIVETVLSEVWLSFYHVVKLRRGPSKGQANHSDVKTTAAHMAEVLGKKSLNFALVYDDLIADNEHSGAPPHANTDEHMAEVLRWAVRSLQAQGSGAEAKTSIWWAWETLSRDRHSRRWPDLLVLLFLGTQRGWWQHPGQCPLFQREALLREEGLRALLGEAPVAGQEEGADPNIIADTAAPSRCAVTMAEGRAPIQRQRQKCANTLR